MPRGGAKEISLFRLFGIAAVGRGGVEWGKVSNNVE